MATLILGLVGLLDPMAMHLPVSPHQASKTDQPFAVPPISSLTFFGARPTKPLLRPFELSKSAPAARSTTEQAGQDTSIVCTMAILRADPGVDLAMVTGAEGVDPGMVVPSACGR